jgi:hypothetical protein
MAEIKDIFDRACEANEIVHYYGTPEQITALFAAKSKGTDKRFVGVANFMQSPAEINHYYKVYPNYTVLIFDEVKEMLVSKTEPKFLNLEQKADALIEGLAHTFGIAGIYPNQFPHTRTRKFQLISGTRCAAIEVIFESLHIKKC